MKILLLTPPLAAESIYGRLAAVAPSLPPLGLCSLGAVLIREGHQVKIIDASARGLSPREVCDNARHYSPAVIGISATTCSYPRARNLLRRLKKIVPGTRLIMGGAHVSARPLQTMRECPELDIAVVGEGELTLKELVDNLPAGRELSRVEGIFYRDGGQIRETPPREPINDLDELPIPARGLLGDQSVYHPTPLRGKGKTTSMITSRGCPLGCLYCDQSVFGSGWRSFSPGRILAEMRTLVHDSGVEFISFEDDNFLFDRDRVERFCRLAGEEDFSVNWGCSVRAEAVDREILRSMKKAGCYYIYLGIESGSPRVLKVLGRNPDLSLLEEKIKMIKKSGILAYGAFMMGNPTETREELARTQRLALSLPLDGLFLFQYTPYPNTPLRKLALRRGKVSSNWEDYSAHLTSSAFASDSFSPRTVRRCIFHTYLRFFLRPRNWPRVCLILGKKNFWNILISFLRDLPKGSPE